MKIVVDSNIVFSAILNTQSKIGQLLINGSKFFDFFSIELLKEEIENHKEKILTISGYTHEQYLISYQTIVNQILFVDNVVLQDSSVDKAYQLVKDIDINDLPFVALNIQLNSMLWTGDKKLANGLKSNHYSKIISTEDLYFKFLEKEFKNQK